MWKKQKHWTKTVGDRTAVVVSYNDGHRYMLYEAEYTTPVEVGFTYPTAHAAMIAVEDALGDPVEQQ